MPTQETQWPAGTPCWADLSVPDLPRGVAFYAAVLGWTMVDSGEEFGSYHIAQVDGRAAAGVGPVMQEGQPSFWTLYIASDDADATVKLVGENGGQVVMPPMDIAGNGRMAICADPTGAVFGVWQALGMIGAGVHSEPGGIVWEDARLGDVEAGRAFYTGVFGWQYGPVPGLDLADYGTFGSAERPLGGLGGMMGAPEGTPSHWLIYFGTADAAAAIKTVQELGGQVLRPAEDTPFGRMAVVTDPFGAPFALHQDLHGQG
jgi:uncharacterized protein